MHHSQLSGSARGYAAVLLQCFIKPQVSKLINLFTLQQCFDMIIILRQFWPFAGSFLSKLISEVRKTSAGRGLNVGRSSKSLVNWDLCWS